MSLRRSDSYKASIKRNDDDHVTITVLDEPAPAPSSSIESAAEAAEAAAAAAAVTGVPTAEHAQEQLSSLAAIAAAASMTIAAPGAPSPLDITTVAAKGVAAQGAAAAKGAAEDSLSATAAASNAAPFSFADIAELFKPLPPTLQRAMSSSSLDEATSTHVVTWRERWEVKLITSGSWITILLLLFCALLVVGSYGAWHVKSRLPDIDTTIVVARGFGRSVTFLFPLLMLTGCRALFTKMRRIPWTRWFPLDRILPDFHKIVAHLLLFCGTVHGLMLIVKFGQGELNGGRWQRGLFTEGDGFATIQLLTTGILLQICFTAVVVSATERFRRSHFNTFWRVHVVGIVSATVLLILHGSFLGEAYTWKWLIVGVACYMVDRLVRLTARRYTVNIISMRPALCKGVVRLEIGPRPYDFNAGQYANITIPAISAFEAHSFTIASAPQDPNLVFYIAAVGSWTRELLNLSMNTKSEIPLKAQVSAPIGAPADRYSHFKHLLLVATGVGATPMASILADISFSLRKLKLSSPQPIPKSPQLDSKDNKDSSGVPEAVQEKIYAEQVWHSELHNRSLLHTHALWQVFWFVNRGSVLYFHLWLTILAGAVSGCCSIFENTYEFLPMLIAAGFSTVFFTIRCTGIALLVPHWWPHKHVLRTLAPRIFVSFLALGMLIAHVTITIVALAQDPEDRTQAWILLDFLLEASTAVTVVLVIKNELATRTTPKFTRSDFKDRKVPKTTRFIWTVPAVEKLWCLDQLVEIVKEHPGKFQIDIFITQNKELHMLPESRGDIVFHSGRPDFTRILKSYVRNKKSRDLIGAFFCGTPVVASVLCQAINEQMLAAPGQPIIFHREFF